ncbi:MAG: restriction endonuclease subunit S [Ekhidna sp.]|nr:restriction endonuclease subunit S [Ekhidna sp.]
MIRNIKIKHLPIKVIDGDRSNRYPKRSEFQKTGVLFLNTANIVQNRLDLTQANFISLEKFNEIRKGRLQQFDIVITTRGSIGKVALFNLTPLTGIINAQMLILRADSKVIDPKFLFYQLCDNRFQTKLRNFASGAAQPQIPMMDLKEIEIMVPPLPIQRKIAAILSAYDDLIENNTRRIKILEDMAQTLYREWFVHFRFLGHENVPMVESPMGPIPQGWEIGEFGDIVENVREKVKPGKHLDHLPYVPIDCIPRRSISLMEHKPPSAAKSSLIAFKRNDILFGAMRSYFHKVIFAPFDGITRQTCFVFRSRDLNNYPFDLLTAFQDSTVQYSSNHSTGSTIPYATWDNALAMMPIFRPPDLLIKRFSDVVIPMLDSIQMMLKKNANLRQTRDLLLPKLISGEIDVSELDIDEDIKSN